MQTALPIILEWESSPDEREWSPTGISGFLECQRKWAWKKIAKLADPPGAGADLGGRAHKMWERYLTTGERPDFVKDREAAAVASTTLHLLPQPKTDGMLIERHFRFKSATTGLIYHGYKDFELPPGRPQPQLELDGSAPIVGDHKTTKSIGDYAKSADDLQENDPQSILYGLDAMANHAAPFADLAWIYAQTKGAKLAKPTVTRLHAKHALKIFSVIEEVASEANAVLNAGLQPLDLPPNPDACTAFGGCPYRHLCNLSPSQKARSRMSNSLIANLRARVQGATPTPAPVVMSDRDVPAPTEIPAVFLAPEPPRFGTPPPVTDADRAEAAARVAAMVADGAVNPPEGELPSPPMQAAAPTEEKPKRTRRTKAEMAAARDAQGSDVHAHTDPPPVTNPPPKPSEDLSPEQCDGQAAADRGVEKTESHLGKLDGSSPERTPQVTHVTNITNVAAPVEREDGFTLYVDCIPIGRPAKAAARLIDQAQERIAKEHGVPDYRLIDFGKGVPFFIAFVDELVDGSFDLALDTRTPEGAVLLETLMAKASLVVRGFR